MAANEGDLAPGIARVEEAVARARAARERPTLALALANLAWMVAHRGDGERGRRLLEESIALLHEVGNKSALAGALCYLAGGEIETYDDQAGEQRVAARLEESLALAREVGDARIGAEACSFLAQLALRQGQAKRARTVLEEGLRLARSIDARLLIVNLYGSLSLAASLSGEHMEARPGPGVHRFDA